jgi:hypothetical protein
MNIELIKEHLSNKYIGVLAANKGFVIEKGDVDLGVDYQLRRPFSRPKLGGGKRYTYDGKYIDIQLKATTEHNIFDEPNQIKYDLEVKNYNDLVDRAAISPIVPLILILFVLPHDRASWVNIDPTELRVRRMAYWYQPPAGALESANQNTQRISIPKTNLLGIDCFDILHSHFYPQH